MSGVSIFLLSISLLIIGGYLLGLLRLLKSWSCIPVSENKVDTAVSVIIPFRNETKNLKRLTQFLDKVDHPDFEVIFVNDHSEDDGAEVLRNSLSKTMLNFRILNLSETEGKKAALAQGIEAANGEIIVSTDADCIMGAQWLKAISAPFYSKNIKMVAGPVSYLRRNAWSNLLAGEFQALIGVTGATIQMKKPTMANGANLAFRKSVFQALNGYEGTLATPSGDDELLMHKINEAYPDSIVFAKQPHALVGTLAPTNWHALKTQRIRWASKWKVGRRKSTMRLAALVGAVQLAMLLLIGMGIATQVYALVGLTLFVKFLVELLFVNKTAKDIGASRPHIGLFTLSFIIYPFYALYIAMLANLAPYTWKGRQYK